MSYDTLQTILTGKCRAVSPLWLMALKIQLDIQLHAPRPMRNDTACLARRPHQHVRSCWGKAFGLLVVPQLDASHWHDPISYIFCLVNNVSFRMCAFKFMVLGSCKVPTVWAMARFPMHGQ